MIFNRGFTLIEILIALFIFTIVTMISTQALQTVINAESRSEEKAMRLRELQTALLLMSKEIEQSIDRPIRNSINKEEPAFKGTPRGFSFSHLGFANPTGLLSKSALERSGYYWNDGALWKLKWASVDQPPKVKAQFRKICDDVTLAHFSYLNAEGEFKPYWPDKTDFYRPLPRAVKLEMHLAKWGKLSQIYVIPAEPITPRRLVMPADDADES